MKEELLYYVWKFGLTNPNLISISGEPIQVIHPGTQNHLSGPDFKNAKIKVGVQSWYGNVEIHVKSSDWIKHKHASDRAYDSIILHVVYENDVDIDEHSFRKVPTLELKGLIHQPVLENYYSLTSKSGWIPCESQVHRIEKFHWIAWMERLQVERLERKTKVISDLLHYYQGDWEKTAIVWLCQSYGFKFNTLPFEWLGKLLSAKMLVNAKNTEALLFGLSGLLPNASNDYYVNQLISDYQFEKSKWKLKELDASIWKTGGLRPPNQPTLRIAQLSAFFSTLSQGFCDSIIQLDSVKSIKKMVQSEPDSYWKEHFNFKASVKIHPSEMSERSSDLVLVNSIVPFLFLYGKSHNKPDLLERAVFFMQAIKPESNSIIRKWDTLGVKSKHAGDAQALLELYNEYCSAKKCLICSVGNKLLKDDR